MKIIDILNKIANGEEVPKKIKIEDTVYDYIKNVDYQNVFGNFLFSYKSISMDFLNTKVEIIEEEKKIPEKINKSYKTRIFDSGKPQKIDYDMEQLIEMVQDIYSKQDEIIDYLQSKGDSINDNN